jgi:hypothetical protein
MYEVSIEISAQYFSDVEILHRRKSWILGKLKTHAAKPMIETDI